MGSPLASQWQIHNCVCLQEVWVVGMEITPPLWWHMPVIQQLKVEVGGPATW